MGLKLTAKYFPPYFERLKKFCVDYRQFDEITFVNTETGQEKTFRIDGIRRLDDAEQDIVRGLTPGIPWDEEQQIYAIDLKEEVKKKGAKRCSAKKN